jgi:hypothetical protein
MIPPQHLPTMNAIASRGQQELHHGATTLAIMRK